MKRRSFIKGSATAVVAAIIADSTVALASETSGEKMNNPLTIIKIGDDSCRPSPQDLERWRSIFASEASLDDYPYMKNQPISAEVFDADPGYNRVLLVKVGDETYNPTKTDLEAYREVFEAAANDKDSKIFTHSSINIEEIKFSKSGKILVE
jgi:hypothetical protein